MKGIVRYQHKFYKKANNSFNFNIKEGDLIKLECKREIVGGKPYLSEYFKYNGIYTVADKYRCREFTLKIMMTRA